MHPNTFITPFAPFEAVNTPAATQLNSTYAITSVGIATLNMLETLLPAAANEVERESVALSGHFQTIIEHLLSHNSKLPEAVQKAVSGIIIGMQFQDRNTQIMQNAASIMERYRSMLVDINSKIESIGENTHSSKEDVEEIVAKILSGIHLSDIRTQYLNALKKANVSLDRETMEDAVERTASEEIELF